jgi:hypothetical protein
MRASIVLLLSCSSAAGFHLVAPRGAPHRPLRHAKPAMLKVEFQNSQQSLQSAILPQKALKNPVGKLYQGNTEMPKIAGVLRAGIRKLCVVTGASSGLGLACVRAMCAEKDNFVICAVRE